MRLLNTKTLEFDEFFESEIPKYLILSHRWQGKETTLQAFEASKRLPLSECTPGVAKIRKLCEMAVAADYEWCWADTCCIDKTSSSELTEAINSMWTWYAEADACYVYMPDVKKSDDTELETMLGRSTWFTRGWTLQEMLAPKRQQFFDGGWSLIGSRDDLDLEKALSSITGIDSKFFGNLEMIMSASICERFRWVSLRSTSRSEDLSYCMLGIFGVNMPLLYGEGHRAFLRLQSEILKVTDDETIFAWTDPACQQSGLLAAHPRVFANQTKHIHRKSWIYRPPSPLTSKGVELEIWASYDDIHNNDIFDAEINCMFEGSPELIALRLHKIDDITWYRADCNELHQVKLSSAGNPNKAPESELAAYNSSLLIHPEFGRPRDPHVNNFFQRQRQQSSASSIKRRLKIYVRQNQQAGFKAAREQPVLMGF